MFVAAEYSYEVKKIQVKFYFTQFIIQKDKFKVFFTVTEFTGEIKIIIVARMSYDP